MIKKAFETTAKKTFAALIYGQTGVGKSTLACSVENVAVIDFDGGLDRVPIACRADYSAGGDWEQFVEDTRAAAMEYGTIVVDTVSKMVECIETEIKRSNPTMVDRKSGGLSIKGFGLRKQMFSDYIKGCRHAGVNLIFVAQETETDEDGRKIRRPAVGSDKMSTELLQDLDLAGYVHVVGGRRVIEWGTVDYAWTKNSCGLPASQTLPDIGKESNDLMQRVAVRFAEYQREKMEQAGKYMEAKGQIDGRLAKVKDCQDLTNAMRELSEMADVLGSKAYARTELKRLAETLACKWDKDSNAYVSK